MDRSIICVTPSIRPESIQQFKSEWERLFLKHQVELIVVWDGSEPITQINEQVGYFSKNDVPLGARDCFCRYTDACRNYGFVAAANLGATHIITLDDDCFPLPGTDPIQEHLDILEKKVPISWMNTAMESMSVVKRQALDGSLSQEKYQAQFDHQVYLRGVPYDIREEAQVMMSHGIWYNVPDFDGETQLKLTDNWTRPEKLPYALPYYTGPIPRGVLAPICGMNLMVRREALPYLYFAPMGRDSGFPNLHRFADIWMGINLKIQFDKLNWSVYTGGSPIKHSRASDPHKNFEQEKLGRKWNEWAWQPDAPLESQEDEDYKTYCRSYRDKFKRYAEMMSNILKGK